MTWHDKPKDSKLKLTMRYVLFIVLMSIMCYLTGVIVSDAVKQIQPDPPRDERHLPQKDIECLPTT